MIDGFAIATLVVFIISIFFVIVPVNIPLPRVWRIPKHIPINLTTAPILAIAILWAAQCLGPSVIRNGIVGDQGIKPYNILILFFSLAYMAITLDITGILEAAAHWVRNKGGSNGRRVFVYFYVMLTLISAIVGNDPVILTGTAFLTYYTKELQLDPMAWIISEFAAANTASMVLFVGNPTNVVICEGFGINNVAYSAYTIFPFMACIVFGFAALFVQFRSDKHIQRVLSTKDQKNPRQFLLDPIGAWVGGALLGCCLAVIIVVSFFNVDVWKISLPFAAAKFIFDMGWDHWRDTKGRLPNYHRSALVDASTGPVSTSSAEKESEPEPAPPHPNFSKEDEENLGESWTSLPPKEPLTESMSSTAPIVKPPPAANSTSTLSSGHSTRLAALRAKLDKHYPTFSIALPRLPFALVPFAFSQFILIEALAHQGWIDVFAGWLVRATGREVYPTVWIMGIFGVILCNLAGTNIGATILLTKVARAADLPTDTLRAAAIALAVASNIGAVSFTFSASLAGLLWKGILNQKGIYIKQRSFAFWNLLPIAAMTAVGLAVVCAEMAVLYK